MDMRRFGRKIKLPSTIAIKHQVKMLTAQYEATKAGIEANSQIFSGRPGVALSSAIPPTEISVNTVSGRIR